MVEAPSIRGWLRAVRAVHAFPPGTRGAVWRAARELIREPGAAAYRAARDAGAGRPPDHPSTAGLPARFGERIGVRRCGICATDDVAIDEWVAVGAQLVCGECGRAVLGGALVWGRLAAAYRGRVGSPRRALGEVYRAVVEFKERRGDWVALAAPLARALALCIDTLVTRDDGPDRGGAGGDRLAGATRLAGAGTGRRAVLVPVPSYRGRRPHVLQLVALAAVRLPRVSLRLHALTKTHDFTQKGLTRREREAESAGAYAVRAAWRRGLQGRHVIIADDLVTTGATLDACARALLAAGAATVDGAAVVRVVRAPPERVVMLGPRQVRVQLRELDGRGRIPIDPGAGLIWVQFACSARCPATALAGPYPLPGLDVVGRHRWMCRCGSAHLVRVRREWLGAHRECLAVAAGDRRPAELLVAILQGPPAYVS